MNTHPIQWQAPEPLWSRFGTATEEAVNAPDQFRPAILRFATDDFMEQMLGTLAHDPAHIGSLLARPETWRTSRTSEEKDMVERVVLPRIVQAVARRFTMARPKSAVPVVKPDTPVEEKKQKRILPLKLYQPAHQRFYLVSASLVCRLAGLPDKSVVPGGSEQMGFVLRRMLPFRQDRKDDADRREFAFVKNAQGCHWQQIVSEDEVATRTRAGEKLESIFAQMAAGEELLPLFPLGYRDALDHARTLWTGLIPVGRREEYMGVTVDRTIAPSLAEAQMQSLQRSAAAGPATTSITARMTQFKMEVAEPWKNLIRAAYKADASLAETRTVNSSGKIETIQEQRPRAGTLNLQWQMQSWLILLDFADFLATYLPDVWTAINTGKGIESLKPKSLDIYQQLGNEMTGVMPFPTQKPSLGTLRAALKAISASSVRVGLEGTDKLYGVNNATLDDWPDFHFLLAGLDSQIQAAGAFTVFTKAGNPGLDIIERNSNEVEADLPKAPKVDMDFEITNGLNEAEKLDRLTVLIVRALEKNPEIDAPEPPFAQQLSKAMEQTQGDDGRFVVRYVHIKRDCGPLQAPMLSEPTQKFQLASFFDYDAPARPIRITLPLDTTPAGMRKHGKNTAFIISDVLCGQIQRAKGLGFGDLVLSVLPWPFHKDLKLGNGGACDVGMICSLSIPIITICALILVTIIVSLLDFIFHWLPYFIICFPVKGLKGKREEGQ